MRARRFPANHITVPAALLAAIVLLGTTVGAQTPAPTKTFEGGAQVVVVTLNDLQQVALDLKHLNSAASHLYDEVTMQPVTLNTMPEMIGPGMIINIPISTSPTGEVMPAKPARGNAAMTQISAIATLMKSDVDAYMNGEKRLDLSDDARQELTGEQQQWITGVNNIYGQFTALQSLTQGPPYNQPAIANAAASIVQNAKDLEKVRKLIHKVLQREGKRAAKLAKEQKS